MFVEERMGIKALDKISKDNATNARNKDIKLMNEDPRT